MERITYQGWQNCVRLANERVELIISGEFGPRILHFGVLNQANEFFLSPDDLGKKADKEHRFYGGHRLWHAPEAIPRTYFPDNAPIKFEEHEECLRLIQPLETTTGIEKQIDLRLSPDAPHVQLNHRFINRNLWAVELAPWALSMMAPGGTAIVPLPPYAPHGENNLLPVSSLVQWSYTDLTDPHLRLGKEAILIHQDPETQRVNKIGTQNHRGWLAYANRGHLFIKTAAQSHHLNYPDNGCAVEVYFDQRFLELETLGPIETLPPGGVLEHVEHWYLFDRVPAPQDDHEAVELVRNVWQELAQSNSDASAAQ